MNLVGKILTGLIALFSVLFAALVLVVYATHTNWRQEATKLSDTLKKEQQEKQSLQTKYDDLNKAFDIEKKGLSDALGSLRTEAKNLQADRDDQKKQLTVSQEEQRKAVTAMTATQENLKARSDEVGKLRQEVRDEQQKRDTIFKQVVSVQDALQQAENERRTLKARYQTLFADAQNYRKVLDLHKLKYDPSAYADQAPDVSGRVTSNPGTGLIEIDIGADDGLMKGHRLHVYRMTADNVSYLGQVEVVNTQPQKAVGKILPDQKGPIQKDDRVRSRLQ